MFHAGTPQKAKKHILNEIREIDSNLRILICIIAFGMGVNCSSVYRVIHFGAYLICGKLPTIMWQSR